jgi:hypothetical protein
MKRLLRATVAGGVAVTFLVGVAGPMIATDGPPIPMTEEVLGREGCTPGFWKNHPAAWVTAALDPAASFDATFGVAYPGGDVTLGQAVARGGGDFAALGRHAVAALANARHGDVDYPYAAVTIVSMVQQAVASGDSGPAHGSFAVANEAGCPTNGK